MVDANSEIIIVGDRTKGNLFPVFWLFFFLFSQDKYDKDVFMNWFIMDL